MNKPNAVTTARRRRRLTPLLIMAMLPVTALVQAATQSPSSAAPASQTWTGNVSTTGTKFVTFTFSVLQPGDINASLDWVDPSADLNLFLNDPSGTQVAAALSKTNKPETVSYTATTVGTWKLSVKAVTGGSNFTLNATYPPSPYATIGDRVWTDENGDGVQDASETTGVSGVTVELRRASDDSVVASQVTTSTGAYSFGNVNAGTYYIHAANIPVGASFSPALQGTDTTKDSDVVPATGNSAPFTVAGGDNRTDLDVGVIPPNGRYYQYTGFVDANGTVKFVSQAVNVDVLGLIKGTVDWDNPAADLNLFLTDPNGVQRAQATSTTTKPESISFSADMTGLWKWRVKAQTGSANFTLTVQLPPAPPQPAAYVSTFGYLGHAGLYAYGIGYDPTDNTVLVGDIWNYRVLRYDANGNYVKKVSQHANKDALGGIGSNFDVAPDPSGNVWVADQSNARVVEFDHNGNWIKTIGRGGGPQAFQSYPQGCGGGSMQRPTNLLIDAPNNRLYVSDPNCRDIYVFDLDGHFQFAFNVNLTSIGVPVPVVRGIDMDNAGHIYVVEQNSRRVLIYDTSGHLTGMFAQRSDMLDPRGLTVDTANNWVYVVDAGGNDVYRYDFAGNMLLNFNSAGTTRFDTIRYMDVDPAGNMYIGDTWGYRVWKLDKNLNVLPWATGPQPPPNGGFNQINGIGIEPTTGRLYAVDTFENRMQAFQTKNGSGNEWECRSASDCPSWLFQWGQRGYNLPSTPAVINYPRGLTANAGGVWVGDAGAVIRFDADGHFVSRWSSQGPAPGQHRQIFGMQAIGDATSGVVYTTDVGNCRLQEFDYAGNLLNYMGSCGSGANQMNGPQALAVASNGVWVADSLHNRIVLWDLTSKTIVKTISGVVAGKSLYNPTGLAIDPAGTYIYIADTGNNRIVRVRLSDMQQELASNGADLPAGAWTGPQAMTFGPDGLLYVSDRGQHAYVLRITS